jgi:hypothetical protein
MQRRLLLFLLLLLVARLIRHIPRNISIKVILGKNFEQGASKFFGFLKGKKGFLMN